MTVPFFQPVLMVIFVCRLEMNMVDTEFSTADMTFRRIYSSLYRLSFTFIVTTWSCIIIRFIWLVEKLLFCANRQATE